MSLEPPKRRTGPQLGQAKTRMDGLGGPSTVSGRNRSLMGNIGREKTHDGGSAGGARPINRKPTGGGNANVKRASGPVSMGGASQDEMDTMVVRRKGTARIPKKGGGIQGVSNALDSMGSGRRAPAQPPAKKSEVDPAARQNLPPVVNVPIPSAAPIRGTGEAPPPPGSRASTIAGVSAEELLGAEGRQVMENMRQRASSEVDTREMPMLQEPGLPPQQQAQQPNLAPGTMDSSRMAFTAAEYTDESLAEQQKNDELAPQGNFMKGPTRQIKRDVLQTPMPVDTPAQPESDDLGYERPVDFGDGQVIQEGTEVNITLGDTENPKAPESHAHDEMEQRAGYLLWLQGVITREEVEDALAESDVPEAVQELLSEGGFADQEDLYRFLARNESLAPIDFDQCPPSDAALAELRSSIARSYRVVPVCKMGDILLIAASFPFDPQRLLELRHMTSSKIKLFVATDEDIDAALKKYYPSRATSTIDKSKDSEASGEELESVYDPTLPGEDSGLYSPLSDNPADVPVSGDSGVALAEVDEAEESHYEDEAPTPPEASDTLRDDPIADDADLDESTLDSPDDEYSDLDDGLSSDDDEIDLDGGPEDHDPFA
ncbi:MAG: GspE/PulE/PilB domain-containing protein [Planctomycetota bacterium]